MYSIFIKMLAYLNIKNNRVIPDYYDMTSERVCHVRLRFKGCVKYTPFYLELTHLFACSLIIIKKNSFLV